MNTTEYCKNDDQLILVVSVLLDTELQGEARQGRERRRDPVFLSWKSSKRKLLAQYTNPKETI